jgi:ribose 5-phosphate isomerase B
MRIAIGSDHAGFTFKGHLIDHLTEHGHKMIDIGTFSSEPVDYPDICANTARCVVDSNADFGIVIGGSGQGEAIAANKVHGARAALCHDRYTTRYARRHNDANLIALGARTMLIDHAIFLVDIFLATTFDGGRHQRRIEQIRQIELQEGRDEPSAPQ